MVIDLVIPSNGNIRKEEHEKLETGLKEDLEKMWGEGNSGANSDRCTGGCNPQARGMTPADI